ncbi:RNA-directed DNA polymerase (Reverse transcriptase) (plasmid) [Spirosoma linguale DSM 74]|uniref:RNA-directed DNA polymerase (Reverse transcriptase) n=2 Tax=Spirosoma TaxID=107 RepID=D2QVU8_SPILD|nr:RNA-directed DNA polymerase (Reverse transcriptase) [Spirosoma linguale DSM 74]
MDLALQADYAWVLSVQRKLYQWSQTHPTEAYRELWNWLTDLRNLREAWRRVAQNKGKRTPGIDGMTVGSIRQRIGEAPFLATLQQQLRTGSYKPSPCRRKLIPKAGKPGKFRPLGIPTIADRVVQSAIKQVLEPILEARFWPVSYGFRPGRGCHGALEHIRMSMRPRKVNKQDNKRHEMPYQWVIEGDIQSCFDHIDHHQLMDRIRQHSADRRVNQLLVQFLKAGILSEEQFLRTDAGTPQGGIVSPLLANVALGLIEERYERWVNHQTKRRQSRQCDGIKAAMWSRSVDRQAGRAVYFPFRYADDFVILVSGTQENAQAERKVLQTLLQEKMGLTLSPEKTKITPLTEGFQFLGHRVSMRWDYRYGWTPRLEIPKQKAADLRYRIKQLTGRATLGWSLDELLQKLNPILRGWGNFYKYCTGAKKILSSLDWYGRDRIWRWLRKKYPKANAHLILKHRQPSQLRPRWKVWRGQAVEHYQMGWQKVMHYQRGWMKPPEFMMVPGEPDA